MNNLGTAPHTADTLNVGNVTDQLNSFLRGEISAVETYRQAIEKLRGSDEARGIPLLTQCMNSHQARVEMLTQEIVRLGGTPAEGSGAWGAFAKLVEGGAALLGEKSAIAVLEEGEDHGLSDYETSVPNLDLQTRKWVEQRLYPEQRRTHDALRDYKHQLS